MKATLIGSDGSVLDSASGNIAVQPLRPGEPGPFQLSSSVDSSDVADVEWTLEPTPPAGPVNRDFLIRESWILPYGDREPASSYYTDPAGGPPFPFVFAGDVESLAGANVGIPSVVVAWVDQDLRVRWVSTATVGQVPFSTDSAATLPNVIKPRGTTPFFAVVDDPEAAPMLSELAPVVWAIRNAEGA